MVKSQALIIIIIDAVVCQQFDSVHQKEIVDAVQTKIGQSRALSDCGSSRFSLQNDERAWAQKFWHLWQQCVFLWR